MHRNPSVVGTPSQILLRCLQHSAVTLTGFWREAQSREGKGDYGLDRRRGRVRVGLGREGIEGKRGGNNGGGKAGIDPSTNLANPALAAIKQKVKQSIAVCETSPHRYGKSHAIQDHSVVTATRQQ